MENGEDEFSALVRIEAAAEAGDVEWQMILARFYEKRVAQEKQALSNEYLFKRGDDKKRAQIKKIKSLRAKMHYWYSKAAAADNHEAQYRLFKLSGREDSAMLEKAIAGGYSEALCEIGAKEEAIEAATSIDEKSRVLFQLGKHCFEKGKTAEEKQKGLETLFQSALFSLNFNAATYLFQAFKEKKIAFSYLFFRLFYSVKKWREEFSSVTTQDEFEREKGKYKRLCDVTKAVLNALFEGYKEKYGEDFEIEISMVDSASARVLIKYAWNVAEVYLSANIAEWKESFEKFLDVFCDKMRSPDEIIAAGKLCGINWASSFPLKSEVRLNTDKAVFFVTGEVNFSIVSNMAEMKKIVVTPLASGIEEDYWIDSHFKSLEELVLPKMVHCSSIKLFKNARLQNVDSLAFNIHDGLSLSADGKRLLAVTDTTMTHTVIPDTVEVITEDAFSHSSIETVELPKALKVIEWRAFSHCEALKEMKIPDSVEEMGEEVFEGCVSLERVSLGSGVKQIKRETFAECSKLKEVAGLESVELIGQVAFRACASLESIDGAKRLRKIDKKAFEGCARLLSITLAPSVVFIGENAFPDELVSLHFEGTDRQWAYVNMCNRYNRKLLSVLSTKETGVLKIEY